MKWPAAVITGLAACLFLCPCASQGQTPPPLPRPAPMPPPLPGPPPLPVPPPLPAPQPGPPPLPSRKPVPSAERYFYDDSGRAAGPYSLDEIVQLIKFDKILPSTKMWKASTPARLLARDMPELEGPPWPGPCGGANQVVWDTFRTEGLKGPVVFSEDTKLKLKASPGKTAIHTYKAMLPDAGEDGSVRTDAYEACLAVQTPHAAEKPADTYALLQFGVSADGYYALLLDAAGEVAVYDGHPSPAVQLLGWRRLDAVKTGPGAVNILQVVVKAKSATLLVNGAQLVLPPVALAAERGAIGYGSHSEEARRDTWKFLWAAATEAQ
jgi:hypothetical protein